MPPRWPSLAQAGLKTAKDRSRTSQGNLKIGKKHAEDDPRQAQDDTRPSMDPENMPKMPNITQTETKTKRSTMPQDGQDWFTKDARHLKIGPKQSQDVLEERDRPQTTQPKTGSIWFNTRPMIRPQSRCLQRTFPPPHDTT